MESKQRAMLVFAFESAIFLPMMCSKNTQAETEAVDHDGDIDIDTGYRPYFISSSPLLLLHPRHYRLPHLRLRRHHHRHRHRRLLRRPTPLAQEP